MDDFIHKEKGWLYGLPFCEVMGFVNTKYADKSEEWPDIQLFLSSAAENTDGGLFGKRITGLDDETYAAVYEKHLYKDAFNIIPLLLRPRSRGKIALKSILANDPPLIYPNYFSDPMDLKVLVSICFEILLIVLKTFLIEQIEGAKIAYALTQTNAMKAINATLNSLKIPKCSKFDFLSDEYLMCQAKEYSFTIYHPVSNY